MERPDLHKRRIEALSPQSGRPDLAGTSTEPQAAVLSSVALMASERRTSTARAR